MTNNHLKDYLNYFLNLEKSPEFAVLIRGPWGCGKTWFIKDYIKENNIKHLYISLNGVSRIKEIEDSFFQQIHPFLSSTSMKLAGKILGSLVKTTINIDLNRDGTDDGTFSSSIPNIEFESYLKKINESIIVFDDLERCSLPIHEVLGYINHFIEVNGLKVILLANEIEIIKNQDKAEEYLPIKEKLIGKSFDLSADYESAKTQILGNLNFTLLVKHLNNSTIVDNIYSTANYQNLRQLKQSLMDFERFISLVPFDSWNREGLIDHLLELFLAISFEIKKGNLTEIDIPLLFQPNLGIISENNKIEIKDIIKKYNVFQLSLPLRKELLFSYFKNGTIDKTELEISIKSSIYYKDETTPYWQKLYYLWDLDNSDFEKLRNEALKKLDSYLFTDKYELLHICGILINLSLKNLISHTPLEIKVKSFRCFERMRENSTLNITEKENFPSTYSHGLEYSAINTFEMKEILQFALKMKTEFIEENYPSKAQELCEILSYSPHEFNELINITNSPRNLYYETPIFKYVDPIKFCDTILLLKNKDKRWIPLYMEQRYKSGRFNKKLSDEVQTLNAIIEYLTQKLSKLENIEKEIIHQLIMTLQNSLIAIKNENNLNV